MRNLAVALRSLGAFFAAAAIASGSPVSRDGPGGTPRPDAPAAIPVFFVPNAGQMRADVRYRAATGSGAVFFTAEGVFWTRRTSEPLSESPQPSAAVRLGVGVGIRSPTYSLESVRFEGSRRAAPVSDLDPVRARISFFHGSDPSRWRAGLPAYSGIVYQDLYPGIDLRFQGERSGLRSTFVVAPGADPTRIRWRRRGAEERPAFAAPATGPSARDSRLLPELVASQTSGGRRLPVEVRLAPTADGHLGLSFPLGYDASRALLVDARIVDATYLGGSGDDIVYALAGDADGSAYVAGSTLSTDFPATGAIDSGCGSDGACDGGFSDAFVAKIDPTQTGADSLVYATYLGGSADDVAVGIAVDDSGTAYVSGIARAGFPTTGNAFQTDFGSAAGAGADGFLARLSSDGASLLYSSYFGGSNGDGVWAIAADDDGNAWIAGQTYSTDFPATAGVADESCGTDGDCDASTSDAFLARLDTDESGADSLVFSSYLGGSGDDQAFGVARIGTGALAVTGRTTSTDFPTQDPFQDSPGGGWDAFVTVFDDAAENRIASTYLGGTGYDDAYGVAADGDGILSFAGTTGSADLPTTPDASQRNFGGVFDAWFARLDPAVAGPASLLHATYLGGSNDDAGFGLALDERGDAWIAGYGLSADLRVPTCPVQPGSGGGYDAFLAKLRPTAAGPAGLAYLSYVGGIGTDAAYGIALAPDSTVFLAGQTGSADFPLANPADDTLGGTGDGFFAAISLSLPAPASLTPSSGPPAGGTPVTILGTDFENGATVSIGGADANGAAVTGPTQITATTAALSPGTLNDLAVTNLDGCAGILPKAFFADFSDVADLHLFHDAVEKIFRAGVTAGCGSGIYCPGDRVTRDQMAIFLLRGKHGASYAPPPATGTVFGDVSAGSFGAAWIEQLFVEQITAGCGGGNYCPTQPVNRASMAVMLLRARHGGTYQPPSAVGMFTDVAASDPFARWIEQLAREGITSGCGGGAFCPDLDTTRGEMAAFLARTFGL
jgi:hypothetical protein